MNLKASFASGNCVEGLLFFFLYVISDSEQELENGGMGNCCCGEDFGINSSEAVGQCQVGGTPSRFPCHFFIICGIPWVLNNSHFRLGWANIKE